MAQFGSAPKGQLVQGDSGMPLGLVQVERIEKDVSAKGHEYVKVAVVTTPDNQEHTVRVGRVIGRQLSKAQLPAIFECRSNTTKDGQRTYKSLHSVS